MAFCVHTQYCRQTFSMCVSVFVAVCIVYLCGASSSQRGNKMEEAIDPLVVLATISPH